MRLGDFHFEVITMSTCSIRVYDRDFNWLNETTKAESVQITRELYGAGSFEIHIHPAIEAAYDLIKKDNIIVINRDGHKAGVVRDFRLAEDRRKREFVIHGDMADGLTRRRIAVPPTEAQRPGSLGWDRIRGPAETVIKHYAAMHMVMPYNPNRIIPRLHMAEDAGRGRAFPWQTRYEPLHEVLHGACQYAEMGYGIFADTANARWVFDVIPGTDRTASQDTVSPVTFRVEYNNIDNYRYAEDRQNHKNTGYAGGQGQDERRLVYVLGDTNAGLDRREVFLDCGNAGDIDELLHYGGQRLLEYGEVKAVEISTLPRTFIFEKDYFLGDMVTVIISRLGLAVDTRITSIRETWERGTGHAVEARFGAKLPNLFTVTQKTEVIR
jgi:hypothetical protein